MTGLGTALLWAAAPTLRAAGTITLRLNIPGPHSLPFLPYELIPRLGIDQRLGARLVLRYFPNGVRALEDVLTGHADFASLGFSVLPTMHLQGHPVVAVAANSGDTPPFALVVRPALRDQIHTLADLRGHSIGVPSSGGKVKTYLQTTMEMLLAAHGVAASEVRWVPTSHTRAGVLGALRSQLADALFCEEPFVTTLLRQEAGFSLLDFSDPEVRTHIPGIQHLRAVLATTRGLATGEPGQVALMVQMLRESLQWLQQASPEDIVSQLDISDAEQRTDLTAVLHRINMYNPDGSFSRRQMADTLVFLRAARLDLPPGFSLDDVVLTQWAGTRP